LRMEECVSQSNRSDWNHLLRCFPSQLYWDRLGYEQRGGDNVKFYKAEPPISIRRSHTVLLSLVCAFIPLRFYRSFHSFNLRISNFPNQLGLDRHPYGYLFLLLAPP